MTMERDHLLWIIGLLAIIQQGSSPLKAFFLMMALLILTLEGVAASHPPHAPTDVLPRIPEPPALPYHFQ